MRCLALFLFSIPLAAQTSRWTFGVTGGVPLGRIAPRSDESRRYTFGPAVEVSLAERISVLINPLYKRTGSSLPPFTFPAQAGVDLQLIHSTWRMRAHSLELPVIGKYSFGNSQSWRPFAGAGFSFQSAWQTAEGRSIFYDAAAGGPVAHDFKSDDRTSTDVGAVFSAGAALKRGRLEFVPELRYTRWGSATLARDRHQAEVLFSIRF